MLWVPDQFGLRSRARQTRDWWDSYWLRVQSILTPLASPAAAFGVGSVRSPDDVLTGFTSSASAGVMLYTAGFASLEGGVLTMVLARRLYLKMEADLRREEEEWAEARRREGAEKAIALAIDADKARHEGETLEQTIKRLKDERQEWAAE